MMNKYQEQLNQIIKEYYQLGDIIHDLYKYADYPDNIKCDLLKELVDKATPKKLHKKANLTNKICPTCYLIFSLDKYDRHEKNNHCHNCGQALDWSEND